MQPSRSIGIDVARGLAVVLMVQTHAYDGFVSAEARSTLGFRITRFLGVLPLPTFLVLAGIGLALRIRSAIAKGEPASDVRAEVFRRGLEIVGVGYLVNLGLGLIDGATELATFLRIDVLHAIGFSIALVAPFIARAPLDADRLVRVGAAVFAAMALAVVPLTRLGRSIEGPLGFVAGAFVEVPSVTRMPVVPLAACLGVGLVVGARGFERARSRSFFVALAAASALVAIAGYAAMGFVAERLGGTLDRTHPAIVFNLVELSARAVALVALVIAVDPRASSPVARILAALGRHSLLGYAVHLPFVYGRIPRPIARSLDMASASVGFAVVMAFTTLVVLVHARREARRPPIPT